MVLSLQELFYQVHGGTVQLVEMDGTVVWEYTQQVVGELTFHHDLKPVGNGNILVTVWEFLSVAEMEALGWQPVNGVNGVWMEKIQELEPNLLDGSTTVVWEWALENHLAQDLDANRANFANVGAERGRVDINFNASITSCLLYTSPSPRDQRGSRMPSSA